MNGLAMFAEMVDICYKLEVAPRDIGRLRYLAIRFVEHYERDYVRNEMDRARMWKCTIHALLHLADCMKEFGILHNLCQYWNERFIGWIVGRLNAKSLAAKSLLNSAVFMESDKIFFRRAFHIGDEGYYALAEARDLNW